MDFNNKEWLMDYLYGELSTEEKKKAELYLQAHPEIQKELVELQTTRDLLQKIPVMAPTKPLVLKGKDFSNPQKNPTHKWIPDWNKFSWNVLKIAASIALILWTAQTLQLSIHKNKESLKIGFGNIEPAINTTKTETKYLIDTTAIMALIEEKIKDKDIDWQARLATLQSKIPTKAYAENKPGKHFSTAEVNKIIQDVRNEDFSLMEQFMLANHAQQKEYLSKSFQAYTSYWEQQYKEDLALLARQLEIYKKRTEEKLYENDVILTKIIEKQNDK